MRALRILLSVVLVAGLATVLRAQTVTNDDLARLDATANDIAKRVDALKATDPTLSTDVGKQLSDLRDEVTYLKVKLRRGETVSRDDYNSLRDRFDTLRIRATGERVTAQPALEHGRAFTFSVGTELDVRLQTALNSGTAKVEQRFEATTILDMKMNNEIAVPAGTVVRGFVSSVSPAGRIDRRGNMTLSFDEMLVGKTPTRIRASVEQAMEGKMSEDLARMGVIGAAGAAIGGLIGGGKGALIGVLVGTGGTMASTEGSDVNLPVGTILRIRLDEPLTVIVDGN
ncbi:MAG TPA: hypothetical protein VLT86_03195 [Vicinamibacterales bacterium]|nr:hypothetical protein [Vicinamibacterales bacterium]